MLKFKNDWAADIARITTRPEFQNAKIRIEDPSLAEPVENEAGEWVYPEGSDAVVYEGRARIIAVRWGVSTGGEGRSNADTETSIRVQLPRTYPVIAPGYGEAPYGWDPYAGGEDIPGTYMRFRKGCVVYVTECEQNPVLTEFSFRVTSDMQGSSAASRTFEAALSSDVEVSNG